MAARFWVTGGTGNWNSTTNWSATTGGASGASVPGSSDTATLDASSGAGTVTLDISPTIQTLTCTGFTGTLAFGTNTISLNSTGTIFTGATTMTVTGTPLIIATNSSATSRTIIPTLVTEANSISFRVTAGTGTFTFSTTSAIRDVDFTDGINPTGYAGALTMAVMTVYGNFKASTGMTCPSSGNSITFASTSGTKTINTAGVTFDKPLTFNGVGGTWQLQDALTSGATRTCTLTNGTLDLNGYTLTTGGFSSSNSNTRTLAFGSTGKIVLTATATTVFTTTTATNLTVTGTNPLIQLTTNATTGTRIVILGNAGESNAISVEVTAGSDTVQLATTSGSYKNFSAVGFTGTINIGNTIRVWGNFNAGNATSMIGVGGVSFLGAATSKTIRSNGLTFPAALNFDGVSSTWSMQDALSVTGALTMTNGTLQLKAGTTSTVGSFATSGTNQKYLQSTTAGTQATISDSSGTNTVTYLTIQDINATGGAVWDANAATNANVSNNSGWDFSVAIGNGWGLGGWGLGPWGVGEGVFATGSVGSVGASVSITLTGVSASGNVGSITTSSTKALTGVLATGNVGSVGFEKVFAITGVGVSGSVGTVVGSEAIPDTGDAAVGNVGTVVADRSIALTGVAASGAVGTVVQSKSVDLSGVAATGNTGSLGNSRTVALSGVLGSGLVGTVSPDKSKALTGVAATGAVGTVSPAIAVGISGVTAQGVAGGVIVPLPSNQADGAVGSVTADRSIALTGVGATGRAGTMTVAERVKALTGVAATGAVGDVIAVYWKLIDDSENANWQNISNLQTPAWTIVATTQTPEWEEIVT